MDTTGSFAIFFGSSVLPRSFAHIPVLAIDFALALVLVLALDLAVAYGPCLFLVSLSRLCSSISFFPTVLSGPLLIRFIGPGGLVSMAFGVFVQRVHDAWPTAVRKSVFGPICAATGAPKEHFGCHKATTKCTNCGLFEKLAKLIWNGKYHTIPKVGPITKAVVTVSKCV